MRDRGFKNYFIESLCVTFCCCLPFGVIGMLYAAQSNSYLKKGDYPEALKSAEWAKKWMLLGFWLGLVVNSYIALQYIGHQPGAPS
jgi:hypothetical protein